MTLFGRSPDIEQELQICLDLIQSRQASVAQALARYPQSAEALRPLLETAVWFQARCASLAPRPGFIKASRQRLVTRIQHQGVARAEPAQTSFLDGLWTRQVAAKLAFVLATTFLLVFVMNTGFRMAEASLPGDALYRVKLTMEQAQLALSLSEAGDAQLYLQFSERRVSEIEALILESNYSPIDETVARFDEQMGQAMQLLDNVAMTDPELAKGLTHSFENTLVYQSSTLSVLVEIVPAEERAVVERAIQISESGKAFASDLGAVLAIPVVFVTATPTPIPTSTPTPTSTSTATQPPTVTPTITLSPQATSTEAATATPQITITPQPTATPEMTATRKPTKAPNTHKPPTNTPRPTKEPKPTDEPKPTKEPKP